MSLNELTIRQAREGLKKKKFSAVELTTACLDRIKKLELKINAFITVCEKKAIQKAKNVDKQIQTEKNIKALFRQYPLLGIPIGVKDLFCTKGIKTTAASKVLADYVPQYDSNRSSPTSKPR